MIKLLILQAGILSLLTVVLARPISSEGTGGAKAVPDFPRAYVDITIPTKSGRTINVPADGDFQAALDQAKLGDTIILQEGAKYSGNFRLLDKRGSGWIVIRGSKLDFVHSRRITHGVS